MSTRPGRIFFLAVAGTTIYALMALALVRAFSVDPAWFIFLGAILLELVGIGLPSTGGFLGAFNGLNLAISVVVQVGIILLAATVIEALWMRGRGKS